MASKKTSLRRRHLLVRFMVGICICASIMVLYITQPTLLRQADRHIYDVFLRHNGGGTPSPTPAIIDIDEKSLQQLGQWPWPRHQVAQLIKKLTESGTAAIGLDILLAEPDRTSPQHIRESLRKYFAVDMDFQGLPDYLQDNDALLAMVLRQTPSVLGMYTQFAPQGATPLPQDLPRYEGYVERTPPNVPSNAPPIRQKLLHGTGATLPLPVLQTVAPMGSINVAPDPDGIVRSVPLLTEIDGRLIPSLSVRALMRGLNISTIMLEGGPDGLAALRLGTYRIPVTPEGYFHVPFRGGRKTYPYFSAVDVLEDRIPPEELQGRVLFVGTSAPGLLDIRATPFDPVFPGVEVHAATLDAILSGRSIEIPAWIPGAQMLTMGLAGLMSMLAFALTPALIYFPLFVGLTGGIVWGTWYIFQQGIFISPLYGLLTIANLAVSLLAVRFWQESRERRLLKQAFSRYVAPDMVDRIADRGETVLAGEEREVTLMFTDIRGFTTLSEKLAPAQVVAVLNRYFTPMTGVIRARRGTVDKFIGDAIMAFWNAPLDVPQHELQAVHSALSMQAALDALNEELLAEFDIALRMGVGVHTGKVYVGNMGSSELLDYTCIGDTVNLTSRLEGLCPTYGVGVVVSALTAQRCTEAPQAGAASPNTASMPPLPYFLPLDAIRVKGKTQPVEICTPITAQDAAQRHDELAEFAQARQHYIAGDFTAAATAFVRLHTAFAQNALYALYAERTALLVHNPPTAWDGVWTFTKK